MMRWIGVLVLMCSMGTALAQAPIYRAEVEASLTQVYPAVRDALEAKRLYVVFEPDIGANLKGFKQRWGENYNRNGLDAIRSMVFCNAWYANQVSNLDPDWLALCPLRLTLIEHAGRSRVLFVRPGVIAAGSPAQPVLQELEQTVIDAVETALDEVRGGDSR